MSQLHLAGIVMAITHHEIIKRKKAIVYHA